MIIRDPKIDGIEEMSHLKERIHVSREWADIIKHNDYESDSLIKDA